LIEGFWSEESTPFIRRMILDEAAGKKRGATRWDFNVFGLTLDFDNHLAVVHDLLSEDQDDSVGLQEFLQTAAAFGDDPAEGDGLTEAERRPPTYRVGASGEIEGLDE